jgi:hypothetical protein
MTARADGLLSAAVREPFTLRVDGREVAAPTVRHADATVDCASF